MSEQKKYQPEQVFNVLRRDSKLHQTEEQKAAQAEANERAQKLIARIPAQIQKQVTG